MDAILFDLDNTLYSPQRQLFSLIDCRINRYMREVVGIPEAEVDGLRRRYWADYGVTLQGLIRHHDVDPEDYLEYVHDVDVNSRLLPDGPLRTALQSISLRRLVFTNGSRGHAERVLSSLGLENIFEEIFDIRVASYLPKPFPEPYHQVLGSIGIEARRCLMVEDSVENLRTAKELGMGTILVGDGAKPSYVDVQVAAAVQVPEALAHWFAAV
ncbi:pyrimidine 5'-nucleotidase [Desulfuromonas sp. AOP6]|uniref:pyrimidine 5'-nucleotidase n=1 Tax=Desulfuromonas sp. AOP6 TaxID=1566351 RepID=UPI00126B4E51|nr:pyrimidine 5'-nucleotidase [Desulfuromonas sp. AOP6]BCA78502.1 pyrimidine 5'-nucleotidase [Desulfuromonas sp. AOP6]